MLSIDFIKKGVCDVVCEYPSVRKVELFGSYAKRAEKEGSDGDLLVEFITPAVSLLTLSSLKRNLEEHLSTPVDLLHAPLPDNSFINVEKAVTLYER